MQQSEEAPACRDKTPSTKPCSSLKRLRHAVTRLQAPSHAATLLAEDRCTVAWQRMEAQCADALGVVMPRTTAHRHVGTARLHALTRLRSTSHAVTLLAEGSGTVV